MDVEENKLRELVLAVHGFKKSVDDSGGKIPPEHLVATAQHLYELAQALGVLQTGKFPSVGINQ